MLRPHESLDDFTNIDARPIPAEPPRMKHLRPSGRREVLKPVAQSSELVKRSRFVRLAPLPAAPKFSWYHRSLAFSGALAAAALILGIFAGLYAPPEPVGSQSNVVFDRQPEGILTQYEPDTSSLLPEKSGSRVHDRPYTVRSLVRRKLARPGVLRSAHRPRQFSRPSRLVMSEFVPTTLVIYIENGEVKTRVEPQLAAGYKKRT